MANSVGVPSCRSGGDLALDLKVVWWKRVYICHVSGGKIPPILNPMPDFRCLECDYHSPRKYNLQRHVKKTHSIASAQYPALGKPVPSSAFDPNSAKTRALTLSDQEKEKENRVYGNDNLIPSSKADMNRDIPGSPSVYCDQAEQDTTLIDERDVSQITSHDTSRYRPIPKSKSFQSLPMASTMAPPPSIPFVSSGATQLSPTSVFQENRSPIPSNHERARLIYALQAVSHLEEYIKFLQEEIVLLRSENLALRKAFQ